MRPDRLSRRAGPVRHLAVLGLALGLGACATPPPPPGSPLASTALSPPPSAATPALPSPNTALVCGAAAALAGAANPPMADIDPAHAWAIGFLLGYADRLHSLSPAELASEITSLGEPGPPPMGQMQLGLALSKSQQPGDTARALGLFQRVIAQNGTAAAPFKPLARLLATRLTDRRRLEDTVERQNHQLREQQRRIEQLSERLEAMRAIERSLNRPDAAPGLRSPRAPVTP